ncbi:hypothetical protein ACIBJE_19505 [Micromonospora sp. NPDC050187]|uniref:hypothetical protein n=1 Tax=Micromonospora sp. NPDC050187 TaxID=3364277 RepID=UPI0037971A85
MTGMRIEAADHTVEPDPDQRVTFGRIRECTICLDPTDTGISRIAGTVAREGDTWWLTNSSTTRPLSVVDDLGFRSVLAPGRRIAVESPTKVLVDGTHGQHGLTLLPPAAPAPASAAPPEDVAEATAVGAEVMISMADRLAMVALFAGYLEELPRYDPYPKSYAAAAARLGWPRSTLVKRIEYLRTRLHAAGVPNMTGFSALTNLAEYAISRGLVTREDLTLLRR